MRFYLNWRAEMWHKNGRVKTCIPCQPRERDKQERLNHDRWERTHDVLFLAGNNCQGSSLPVGGTINGPCSGASAIAGGSRPRRV